MAWILQGPGKRKHTHQLPVSVVLTIPAFLPNICWLFPPRQSIRVEFVSFSSASSEGHIPACPKMELARASTASSQLSPPDIFQHVSCRPLSPEIAVFFFFFPLTQTLVCLVLLKAGNVANSWLCFDFMFLFSHGHSKLSL